MAAPTVPGSDQPCTTSPAGIPLARLLDVARLTPAQAVAIGADVLTDLQAQNAIGPSRSAPGRESVRVSADGRAHLVADHPPCHDAPPDGGCAPGADLAAVAALLGDLAAATQRPTPASGPAPRDQLTALHRAVAEARRPGGTVAVVGSILREADAIGAADTHAELARLVCAASGRGLPLLRAARLRSLPPTPDPHRPSRHPRRPRTIARTVMARTWKWVLSIVVLVVAITIEIILLRDTIVRDVEAVLDAGRSGSETATSAPALPPVVSPAPAAGGTISAVDLRAVRPCGPAADCAVRLQVVLQPRPEPQTVTWAFQVVDRCTGARTSAPGGTVTVPPGGDRADAIVTVALPRGDALAVLALTELPATAASAPLLVPADGACGAHPAD